MSKPRPVRYIPSPRPPAYVVDPDAILLDEDFDDVNEQILFEPPILATRRCGGHMTRLDEEQDEDE